MSQKGLSAEELLAKCETREAITRSNVGLDTKQATDGTVYLKENVNHGTNFWKFSKDSNKENDN